MSSLRGNHASWNSLQWRHISSQLLCCYHILTELQISDKVGHCSPYQMVNTEEVSMVDVAGQGWGHWTTPVKSYVCLCPQIMARVVNWELKLWILPLCSRTSPISFTIISCQHKQGLSAAVPTLTSPSLCLRCTALFPSLLHPRCSHLPKVNKTWTWTKLNLFSTPFILIFNHVYCFIQFTKWICLHKCCCLHREWDSSSKGMRGCELSKSEGRGSSILVAAAACAVLVIVKVQKSHNSHHYVCMANLYPANLYL